MAPPAKKCNCPEGVPLWVLTYGDAMSLLLTFFILLVSLSSMEESAEVRAAISAIQQGLGVLPANTGIMSVLPVEGTGRISRPRLMRLARELRQRLQVLGRDEEVQVKFERTGLKISLPNQILFDPASAAVRPEAIPVLRDVSAMLAAQVPDAIIQSRGYTDNRPLTGSTLYKDNYDLSYARSKAVVEQLVELSREAPTPLIIDRFEIIAMGPSNPVATNDTEEGRAANRRVELFIREIGPVESTPSAEPAEPEGRPGVSELLEETSR